MKTKNQISKIKYQKLFVVVFVLVVGSFVAVFPVQAANGINSQVNFQGKLVDNNGLNVADSSYSVVFTLYDASSGGTNLWSETDSVTTTAGIFQVALGAGTSLSTVNFNSDSLYLGIKVGSDSEMTPRIRFTAVPYALNAQKVNGLMVTNTSGNPFSSTTTLQIGDGKTVAINNGLTFSGTDGTTITFQGTDTYVGRTTTDVLTNKSIGSTGLTFSGAATDITTGADEDLTLTPAGLGNTILTSDFNTGVRIGSAANTPAPLSISGGIGSNASLNVNQLNSGDIFTASASGATKFTIANNGNITSSTYTVNGGVFYTDSTGLFKQTTAGSTTNQVLHGGTTPSFSAVDLANDTTGSLPFSKGGSKWVLDSANGVLSPVNNTLDVVVGGTATNSARFSVLNIAGSLTPIASVSATTTANRPGLSIAGDGTLQSVNNGTLTIGGGTTGNIVLAPLNGSGNIIFEKGANDVTLAVTAPSAARTYTIPDFGGNDTFAALAATQAFTNKTYNGNTITSGTGTLTLGSNTVSLTGSSKTVTFADAFTTSGAGPFTLTAASDGFTLAGGLTSGTARTLTLTGADITLGSTIKPTSAGSLTVQSNGANALNFDTGSGAAINIGNNNATALVLGNSTSNPSFSFVGTGGVTIANGGNNNISFGSNTGNGTFLVQPNAGGQAALIVNKQGNNDIFTASSSGTPRFAIQNNGNLRLIDSSSDHIDSYILRGISSGSGVGWIGQVFGANISSSVNGSNAPTVGINSGGITNGAAISLNGDNNASNNLGLWTGAGAAGTALTERLAITNTGNVGIGDTSPLAALDVRANSGTTPAASISATSSIASLIVNNSGVGDLFTASSSGLNRFVITQNGNVGIGTTTPQQVLDVVGNAQVSKQIFVPETSGTVSQGYFTGTATTPLGAFQSLDLGGSTFNFLATNKHYTGSGWADNGAGRVGSSFQMQDDSFTFYSFDTSNNFTPRFTVASGGDVGIATTTPTALLDVNGAASVSASLSFRSGAGAIQTTANNTLTIGGTTTGNIILNPQGVNYVGIGTQTPLAPLDVRTAKGTVPTASISATSSFAALIVNNSGVGDLLAASKSGATKFVVTNSGRVGIGNAVPLAVLDVNGAASLSGGLTFNGAQTIQTTSNQPLTIGSSNTGGRIAFASANISVNGTTALTRTCTSGQTLNGLATVNGLVTAGTCTNNSIDIAEQYNSTDALEPGDVVEPDAAASQSAFIKKTMQAYSSKALGIISTKPQMILGDSSSGYSVALIGRIPAKVTLESGHIEIGDYITSSSTEGYGMKALKAGSTIGKALESTNNWNETNCSQVASIDAISWPADDGSDQQHPCFRITKQDGTITYVGKIMVFANLSTSLGLTVDTTQTDNAIALNSLSNGQTQSSGPSVDLQNAKAGLELTTDTLQVNTIKPISVNGLSFELGNSQNITIKNASGEAGITFDNAGNATFKGTLTADKIKANQIEGLDMLTSGISSQSAQIASLSALLTQQTSSISSQVSIQQEVSTSKETAVANLLDKYGSGEFAIKSLAVEENATVSGTLRVKGNGLIEGILSVVDTLTTNNLVVNKVADFFATVIFHNDVIFQGRPTFNSDTAGLAVIKKGSDSVEVQFSKAYDNIPMINASLTVPEVSSTPNETIASLMKRQDMMEQSILDSDARYIVTKPTTKGFVIKLAKPAEEDMTFSWLAIAVDKPIIHKDDEQAYQHISPTAAIIAQPVTSIPSYTPIPSSILQNISPDPTAGEGKEVMQRDDN